MASDTTAPPAADRQLAFRRSIEAIARAVTAAEQANAELEADRTPIDEQTEKQLAAVNDRVEHLLSGGRYVGVEYDGDDEPYEPLTFHNLARRVASLGFELVADNEKPSERGYSVFNPRTRTLLAEAGGCTLDGIAHWCAQREGTPLEQLDAEGAHDNPIRAFLRASAWLRGCADHPESADRGHSLVATMAAQIKDDDDDPTPRLTVADCADVLSFLCNREGAEPGALPWGGAVNDEAAIKRYGGNAGYGLHMLVRHVGEQLRKDGAA